MLRDMNALCDSVDTQLQLTDEAIDELPYDDSAFEIVVANGVVSRSDDAYAAVAEIARVLKPGGKLALCDVVRRRRPGEERDFQAGAAPRLFGYLHAIAANGLIAESCRSYGGPCLTLIATKPD
jgi:ubiquinone/menaquinone biosynthesis C-methylase UbiE